MPDGRTYVGVWKDGLQRKEQSRSQTAGSMMESSRRASPMAKGRSRSQMDANMWVSFKTANRMVRVPIRDGRTEVCWRGQG